MHASKKARNSKALQIALIFSVVVGLLIILSLAVKAALVVSRSRFDGEHQFILQVDENKKKSAMVVFSPGTHTITLLSLDGLQVGSSLAETLELPVDAEVHGDITGSSGSDMVGRILFTGHDSLNVVDRIKLLIFSKTVANDDITTKVLQLPLPASFDATLTQLTTDQTLYKEAMTIAIVNGSDIPGVGSAVAKLLTHIGANVISVTTADKEQSVSTMVFTGGKTYTLSRLSKIFGIIPQVSTKEGIADIILTIGKDKGEKFQKL